ncbi:MAG TPA: TRAP transporter substrate-binding protein DctP [Clostridiaceae bacterium]|nr:TRAP transporter substrate-binding protein DctP [Clostridiaceae bacterium]
MKRVERLMALVLAVVMTALLFTGCVQQTKSTTSSSTATGETAKEDTKEEAKSVPTEKLTFKLGTTSSEGQPIVDACLKFAELIKERTNGRITIEVFPGSVLGNTVSIRDSLSAGSIHMASLALGSLGVYSKAANLVSANYFWESEEQMVEVMNSEVA